MSELRAEPLSPIDAATLWPQLHRLNTEVIATRGAEHLLVTSGLAATGLTRLPRVPRTAVLGVKRGLRYRGVVVAHERDGGAGWEAVSARLARDKDDEALTALLIGAAREVGTRGGRLLLLRYPEGSPHAMAIRRASLVPHGLERLFALPAAERENRGTPSGFRPATRSDRAAVFRLYCRAVPEHVRRQEASSQQEWRAVLDSYECSQGFVADGAGALAAWVGIGEREARMLIDPAGGSALPNALDLIEGTLGHHGSLVIAEHQPELEREVIARGYVPLGTRLLCARRLVLLDPLKEAVKVPVAETVPY